MKERRMKWEWKESLLIMAIRGATTSKVHKEQIIQFSRYSLSLSFSFYTLQDSTNITTVRTNSGLVTCWNRRVNL
jgi:hypothetical protein